MASSPVTTDPPVRVRVQLRSVLEMASRWPAPDPDPWNGSGNGASRTDRGVRSMVPLPPVQASGSSAWSAEKYENLHWLVAVSTSM